MTSRPEVLSSNRRALIGFTRRNAIMTHVGFGITDPQDIRYNVIKQYKSRIYGCRPKST